jgi:hypothetical protein
LALSDSPPAYRLRRQDRAFGPVQLPVEAEARFAPQAVDDAQPFRSSRIAVVVGVELQPVLARFLGPPRRDDVEAQPPAADVLDVGRLLGEQRRLVEVRSDRDHQLEPLRHRRERRGGRPSIERGGVDALDVVEV